MYQCVEASYYVLTFAWIHTCTSVLKLDISCAWIHSVLEIAIICMGSHMYQCVEASYHVLTFAHVCIS